MNVWVRTCAGIQIVQCIVYDSGRQRVEPLTKAACGAMIGLAAGWVNTSWFLCNLRRNNLPLFMILLKFHWLNKFARKC